LGKGKARLLPYLDRSPVFAGKQDTEILGPGDIERFLAHLASDGRVSASTRNQAPNARVFLFRERQELLGHADVSTTLIYTRVMNRPGVLPVRSPVDCI